MGVEISIIVPVYNVEVFLERCIKSIITQTFKDIEIILVDDGSTDRSGAICDYFAEVDRRIKVLHKENGGLSDARNAGLEIAKGVYVGFVDSDDFLNRDMYLIMYQLIKQNNGDIIEVGFQEVYEKDAPSQISEFNNERKIKIYDKKQALIQTVMDADCHNYVWNKLYKRGLWNNIRFPYRKVFEDIFTTHKVIFSANRIIKLNIPLYYYTQRDESIVHSRFSLKNNQDQREGLIVMIDFVRDRYPDLVCVVAVKYFKETMDRLYEIIRHRSKIQSSHELIETISNQVIMERAMLGNTETFRSTVTKYLNGYLDTLNVQRKQLMWRLLLLEKSVLLFFCYQMAFNIFSKVKKNLAKKNLF